MKFAGLLVGLVGAMALFVPAQDNDEAGTQSKIIALEKSWNQAYKLGDRRSLDVLLDDHIVLINDDGSVQTKTQFLATVKATNSQEQQVAPESMSVRVFGNTAIAKPSELTPMTAYMLCDIAREAGLPNGVLNVVHGTGPNVGSAITAHPKINTISFTGGTATGRKVAEACAPPAPVR